MLCESAVWKLSGTTSYLVAPTPHLASSMWLHLVSICQEFEQTLRNDLKAQCVTLTGFSLQKIKHFIYTGSCNISTNPTGVDDSALLQYTFLSPEVTKLHTLGL